MTTFTPINFMDWCCYGLPDLGSEESAQDLVLLLESLQIISQIESYSDDILFHL